MLPNAVLTLLGGKTLCGFKSVEYLDARGKDIKTRITETWIF
jgi:hypothetical protein